MSLCCDSRPQFIDHVNGTTSGATPGMTYTCAHAHKVQQVWNACTHTRDQPPSLARWQAKTHVPALAEYLPDASLQAGLSSTHHAPPSRALQVCP
eukprot:365083-Chlamydomonas_euryale.AAC.24